MNVYRVPQSRCTVIEDAGVMSCRSSSVVVGTAKVELVGRACVSVVFVCVCFCVLCVCFVPRVDVLAANGRRMFVFRPMRRFFGTTRLGARCC